MAAPLANVPVHADHSTVSPTTPVNGDEPVEFLVEPIGSIDVGLEVLVLASPGGTSGGADHGAVDAPQLAIDRCRSPV